MSYSTLAEYTERTGDTTLLPAEHTMYAAKAAQFIDLRTFGRAKAAPAEMIGAVKNAEIDLISLLLSWAKSGLLSRPPEVASENNDGYSISYRTDITSDTARKKAMMEVLRQHLLMPVNLLYQGGDL